MTCKKTNNKLLIPNTTYIILWFLVLPLLTSCLTFRPFTSQPEIKEVVKKPEKYEGKTIRITGLVTDQIKFPFRKDGVYRLFDKNHETSIWVYIKEGKLPKRGKKIQALGVLSKNHDFRDKLFGPVLKEEKRDILE